MRSVLLLLFIAFAVAFAEGETPDAGSCSAEANVDFFGNDLGYAIQDLTLAQCCERCDATPACTCFSYWVDTQSCFLKNSDEGRGVDTSLKEHTIVSGYRTVTVLPQECLVSDTATCTKPGCGNCCNQCPTEQACTKGGPKESMGCGWSNGECKAKATGEICAASASCGDGIVQPGEQCDPPGKCCSEQCRFLGGETMCRPANGGECDLPDYCSGHHAACGPNRKRPNGYMCMTTDDQKGSCLFGKCVVGQHVPSSASSSSSAAPTTATVRGEPKK